MWGLCLIFWWHCPLLLARLMDQYCFARWRLSSVIACNAAGRRADNRARGQSATAGPGTWAFGRLTLHGTPVRFCLIRAIPCLFGKEFKIVKSEVQCMYVRCKELSDIAMWQWDLADDGPWGRNWIEYIRCMCVYFEREKYRAQKTVRIGSWNHWVWWLGRIDGAGLDLWNVKIVIRHRRLLRKTCRDYVKVDMKSFGLSWKDAQVQKDSRGVTRELWPRMLEETSVLVDHWVDNSTDWLHPLWWMLGLPLEDLSW